jgi:hypothetical protein
MGSALPPIAILLGVEPIPPSSAELGEAASRLSCNALLRSAARSSSDNAKDPGLPPNGFDEVSRPVVVLALEFEADRPASNPSWDRSGGFVKAATEWRLEVAPDRVGGANSSSSSTSRRVAASALPDIPLQGKSVRLARPLPTAPRLYSRCRPILTPFDPSSLPENSEGIPASCLVPSRVKGLMLLYPIPPYPPGLAAEPSRPDSHPNPGLEGKAGPIDLAGLNNPEYLSKRLYLC